MAKKLIQSTYELYIEKVDCLEHKIELNSISDEEILEEISNIAKFATLAHPGMLVDFRLEKMIHTVCMKINIPFKLNVPKVKVEKSLRILHIGTFFYKIGGHTRMLKNWINADVANNHNIVITSQRGNVDNCFSDELVLGRFHLSESRIKRIKCIRALLVSNTFDLIVLHIHPHDVVALAAIEGIKTPVFIYNHADHLFWLGVSFSNLVIDFAEEHMSVTEKERFAKSTYLPFILGNGIKDKLKVRTKAKTKTRLGIKHEKVLVTMSSSFKYKKIEGYDFFALFSKFLENRENVVLYVIGMTEEEFYKIYSRKNKSKNIILLGYITDPTNYLISGDIFIESFPIGAGLGTLEAMAYGMIPIFGYGKGGTIYESSVSDLFKNNKAFTHFNNEMEYIKALGQYIDEPHRVENDKKELAPALTKYFQPEWNKHLDQLYTKADIFTDKMNLTDNLKPNLRDGHKTFNNYLVGDKKNLLKIFFHIFGYKHSLRMYLKILKICW